MQNTIWPEGLFNYQWIIHAGSWKTCVLFLIPKQRTILKWSTLQGIQGMIYKYTICCADVYVKKGCKFTENWFILFKLLFSKRYKWYIFIRHGIRWGWKWYILSMHGRRGWCKWCIFSKFGERGGGVAVDTSSENLTSTSNSAIGKSLYKRNKKSTNHTPTPTSQ